MKAIIRSLITFCLLLTAAVTTTRAQQTLQLRVASFEYDALDTSCQTHKKIDANGDLMAIVKVTSSTPGDDLSAYLFDFGNMRHDTEGLHDGELWLYVQRNARFVTIRRQGYATVSRHELVPAVEAAKVYRMQLSSESPKVYTQMVLFSVTPTAARAMVSVRPDTPDAPWQTIGLTEEGGIAKNLALGRYLYQVVAENYYQADGSFTLSNASGDTHTERITLRPSFAEVSLTVGAEADIYVNNELKGRRSWRGPLTAGDYQVECRQEHHRPSSQRITVVEGKPLNVTLTPPAPITGTLSVISKPLGATITVDGRDYGQTPRNLTAMLIGRHNVALSKAGYETAQQTVDVREGETASLELTLKAAAVATTPAVPATPTSDDLSFTVTGNGKTVTFKMIRVSPGTFQMGSSDGYSDEKPVHSVTLTKAYYMGQTEVTQALWQAVMGYKPTNGGSQWSSQYGLGNDYPAYYISYTDCEEFITKLNAMTGKKFRMPTEAEWEFAARGGKKSKGYTYAGSNTISDVAWYSAISGSETHPVGGKQANELGLYDMSGNVWEWCADWYGSYSSGAQTNPTGPTTGSDRVIRGGGWYDDATNCRTAYRDGDSPGSRGDDVGFRLAL